MHRHSSSLSSYSIPQGVRRRPARKKYIVNVANTRYPIIPQICQELNYQLSHERESSDWDIFWCDNAVTIDFVGRMNVKQRVNHFSAMCQLSRKALLATNLKRMQKAFPQSYSFFPLTFILPQDVNSLKKYQQRMRLRGQRPTYIIKPEIGCQGRGIYLWQDRIELQAKKQIVQVYLQRPLLFKGLKFDLRVYALVTSCDPLRVYIYNEGLVRLATLAYQRPNRDNIQHLRMHLTNYAINRQSPSYIFNDSIDDLSKGHKKSLAEFFETMMVMGLPAEQYWATIKDTTVKTLIAGLPWLQKQLSIAQPDHIRTNFCFQLLGLDFIIEDNHKVYLLEVNHTPSFFTDTPLDEHLKSNLIKDTFELLNKENKVRRKPPVRGFSTVSIDDRNLRTQEITFSYAKSVYPQEDQCRLGRKQLGSFEQIHPNQDQHLQQKYHNLISYSIGSVSFKAPTKKYIYYETPVRKRINSEPKYITPYQQFSDASRGRIKVSSVLKAQPIRRSSAKRSHKTVFDRQQFKKEIHRRKHPLRQSKVRQSEEEYQPMQGVRVNDDLVDIISYHKRQQQYTKRGRHRTDREEVHYPYY